MSAEEIIHRNELTTLLLRHGYNVFLPVYDHGIDLIGHREEDDDIKLIQQKSRWENGYNESFNGKLRDELLNGEIFYSLREAQVLIEQWRRHYNTIRPHSALGYRPPAPQTIVPKRADPPYALDGLRIDRRSASTENGLN